MGFTFNKGFTDVEVKKINVSKHLLKEKNRNPVDILKQGKR